MLSEMAVRQAKAKDKDYKLSDSEGLYLFVAKSGYRSWRLKYRFAGKERRLILGAYPEVSLKEARDRKIEARKQLAEGRDILWGSEDRRRRRIPRFREPQLMDLNILSGVKPIIMALALTSSIGCNALNSTPPNEGAYKDPEGNVYQVSTSGPSALSITNNSGLCLLFWRYKEPKFVDGFELLKGQDCIKKTADNLDWEVRYSSDDPNTLLLFHSEKIRGSNATTIRIIHI